MPYLLFIKLITHRCISHAYYCVSMDNHCRLELNMPSRSLGLNRELKQYQKRQNRKKAQAEGRRKENIQCTDFLNSCSPVLKSPSSCDFLPLLHRAANSVCTNAHTYTHLHVHTHCTLCAHTRSIRQGLCLSKKVTRDLWGQGICVA